MTMTDDLLDDERHGNDDDGLDLRQGLCDDGWRGHTAQVIHVTAVQELEDELERHAVHVGHRQHGDDAVAGADGLAKHVAGEVVVRPDGAVGQHHALREARGTAGIVDEGQFLRTLFLVVAHVFLAEVLGELLAVEFVQVLAGVGEFVGAAHHQRVVGIVDDTLQFRHLQRIDDRCHMVADEEQARLGVVDDVMDLFGIELMEDGHSHSPVG